MIKKKIFLIASLVMGAALVGGTFAAYAVTDNADPFNIHVTPGSLPSEDIDGYVTLNWGETKTLSDVEGLEMNTLTKAGEIGLKATGENVANYTGVFSIKVTDQTVREESYSGAKLVDLLEVSVYEGKVAAADVEEADKVALAETAENSGVYAASLTVANNVERVLSVFVKIATDDVSKYSQISEDVIELTFDWNKAADDLSASLIYFETEFEHPYVYAWNSESNAEKAPWPGEAMEKVEDGLYSYALSYAFDSVIFSDNGENQSSDQLVTNDIRANTPVFDGSKWNALENKEELLTPTYYLKGSFNNWDPKAEYLFVANEETEGEYKLLGVEIPANSEMKVHDTANDLWYGNEDSGNKDGNFLINEAGTYDFYFRPAGNPDWGKSYIFAAPVQSGEDSSNEDSSTGGESSSEQSSQAEEEYQYYLFGTFNNWEQAEGYEFVLNTESTVEEYMLKEPIEIKPTDGFKAVDVSGEQQVWYPEGMGTDAYTDQAETGMFQVYFRPAGNSDWKYTYLYAVAVAD